MHAEELVWSGDPELATCFAALAEIPIAPRPWRYDRAKPWQTPEPHVWTPDGATLPPGLVWVCCARTRHVEGRRGNPSLRVYPLRSQAPLPAVPLAVLAAGAARLTRRQVLIAGGVALCAVLLPPQLEESVPARQPPRCRIATDGEGAWLRVPHAGLAFYEEEEAR